MRRLARRLFTLCSATSLLLCIAVGILWAWTHRTQRAVEFDYAGMRWDLLSHGGNLRINNDPQAMLDLSKEIQKFHRDAEVLREQWKSALKTYADTPVGSPEHERADAEMTRLLDALTAERPPGRLTAREEHSVSLALCGVTTMLLPTAWLTRRLFRRHKAGLILRKLCPTCGYDLRATPGRCPECGTAAAKVQGEAAG